MLAFRLCLVLVSASLLAACNGKEDFSDAVIGGPVIDGASPDPNFNPADACAPRVIGLLNAGQTVRNVGYTCGGYFNYTGLAGIDSEKEQNFFVCPLNATTVTFFIGGVGSDASLRVSLGSGAFRKATSRNVDTDGNKIQCDYEISATTGEPVFLNGSQYDADGPYLFSVADLVTPPVRVDGTSTTIDGQPNANENRVQNTTVLLTALDAAGGDASLINIAEFAHQLLFNSVVSFTPDFQLPFADFVDSNGVVADFVADVDANTPVAGLPASEADVETAVRQAGTATAAGLYRIEFASDLYGLSYFADTSDGVADIYQQKALVGDLLYRRLLEQGSLQSTPGDTSTTDTLLLASLNEFLPLTVVDRRGRVMGGGAFDVVNFGGNENNLTFDRLCTAVDGIGQPLFMTMDPSSAALGEDLALNNFSYFPAPAASGEVTFTGRYIEGYALSGVALENGTSDYAKLYPSASYVFNPDTDRTDVASTICGQSVSDQVMLGYLRKGVVVPSLDDATMDFLFGQGDPDGTGDPARYTLRYYSRVAAADEDFTNLTAEQDITVHEDGTILTDNDQDGNLGYDSAAVTPVVPAGEYVIGMVSSVFPGPDTNAPLVGATANLLVLNFVAPANMADVGRFGSHFRARLVPDRQCDADNRLFAASDSGVDAGDPAFWYDPYEITQWFRSSGADPAPEDQYAAVRTKSYGVIEAVRTDCPPPPP